MGGLFECVKRVTQEIEDADTRAHKTKVLRVVWGCSMTFALLNLCLRYHVENDKFWSQTNTASFAFLLVLTVQIPMTLKLAGTSAASRVYLLALYASLIADVYCRMEILPQLVTFVLCTFLVTAMVGNPWLSFVHYGLIFASVLSSATIYIRLRYGANEHFDYPYTQFKKEMLAVLARFPILIAICRLEFALRTRHVRQLLTLSEEKSRLAASKNIFFATVSHELRNPLNALLGIVDLLFYGDESNPELLKTAKYCGEVLLNLIGNVLDVSRIEAGKMETKTKPNSLREQLHNLRNMYDPLFKEKKLSFGVEVDEGVPMLLDYDVQRMSQVLINLVGNSAKFTLKGGVLVLASWHSLSPDTNISNTLQRLLAISSREDYQNVANEHIEGEKLLKDCWREDTYLRVPRANILAKLLIASRKEKCVKQPGAEPSSEDEKAVRSYQAIARALPSEQVSSQPKEQQHPIVEPEVNVACTDHSNELRKEAEERASKDRGEKPSAEQHKPAQEGLLKIEVIDTGIGISAEAQKRLFQPFAQADAGTAAQFGGTGLGLYITKMIVNRLMNGDIRIDSEPHEGSNFIVVVPMKVASRPPAPEEKPNRTRLKSVRFDGQRALIVDSDECNIVMLHHLLSSRGFQTFTAQDGAAGLAKFVQEAGRVDLVMTELRLSHMTGQEMILAIRKHEKEKCLQPVPMLVITGEIEQPRNLTELSVSEFFKKPIAIADLLVALEHTLKSSLVPVFKQRKSSSHGGTRSRAPTSTPQNLCESLKEVLIIDDDVFSGGVMKRMLQIQGYRVQQVYTREAALIYYQCNHAIIQTIILDSTLPDGSGAQVLADLRSFEKSQSVPAVKVISISGNEIGMQEEEYAGLHVAHFFIKPISSVNLIAALH